MNRRKTQHLLILGMALVLLPSLAFAGTTVQPGDILQSYQQLEQQWVSRAATIGTALFGVFAGLEFAWTWISWLLEKGGGDGESVVPTLLKKVLQLCFGLFLVSNAATGLNLIGTLIKGFEWLGSHIGGTSAAQLTSAANGGGYMTPSGIFQEGIKIAGALIKSAMGSLSLWNGIGHDLAVVFVTIPMCILIAAIFAFLSLSLIMTLLETYLVIGAGAVFLAFLGSRWTQSFGEKYISYAVSAGVKLFVFFLVLSAGQELASQWIAAASNAGSNYMNYIGIGLSVLVYGMVAMKTPSLASSLISGAGGFLGAAGLIGAAAGVAAATAAAAVTGGAGALALGKLAAGSGAGEALMGMAGKAADAVADAGKSFMSGLGKGGAEASGDAPGLGDVADGALGSALGSAAESMGLPGGAADGAIPNAGSTDAGNAGQTANDAGNAEPSAGTETPAESSSPAEAADASNGPQQAETSNPNAGSVDAGNAGQTANDAGSAGPSAGTETPTGSGSPAEAADASNGPQQAATSNPNAGNVDAGNAGQTANDAGNVTPSAGAEIPTGSASPAKAADASNGPQQVATSNPNAGNVDAGNTGQTANDAGNVPPSATTENPPDTGGNTGDTGGSDIPSRSGLQRVASAMRTAGDAAVQAGKAGAATHEVISKVGEKLQEMAEPLDASHEAAPVRIKLHD